mmetsp:Transcript_46595/g.85373  ORF Transcript_46595/g.85373 Transcript_46595/m.85373 type:complete len:220 (+) Transcript_46595:406-1065(+)
MDSTPEGSRLRAPLRGGEPVAMVILLEASNEGDMPPEASPFPLPELVRSTIRSLSDALGVCSVSLVGSCAEPGFSAAMSTELLSSDVHFPLAGVSVSTEEPAPSILFKLATSRCMLTLASGAAGSMRSPAAIRSAICSTACTSLAFTPTSRCAASSRCSEAWRVCCFSSSSKLKRCRCSRASSNNVANSRTFSLAVSKRSGFSPVTSANASSGGYCSPG